MHLHDKISPVLSPNFDGLAGSRGIIVHAKGGEPGDEVNNTTYNV